MSYAWIYELTPKIEVEPGWWKLSWKPIKNGTYNFYKSTYYTSFGFRVYRSDARNGWNRSWKGWVFELCLIWVDLNFWFRYRIIVHKDGPSDVADSDKRPLKLL